ncbi:Hydroxyacid oxidase 1 [Holothuria leucospilota]|uniref:(S)-2-hydroxy-acid oxidase n=1 Tax=Holothuria leucospilota TaxID=206669 RepID=A0A9Q1C3B2_HOLLE|nr:Hydroxyacid oxidase 1 [Holothuria leucospilota]
MPTHGVSRVADFEELVRDKTPDYVTDFYAAGAGDEQTLEDSVKAFRRFRLRPRVLWSKEKIKIATKLQGQEVSFPLGIAPTGFQRKAHHEGDLATARAASKADVIMVFSSWSLIRLEEAAAVAPNVKLWMQVYPFKDRRITIDMVKRAERSGFKAIVVTVDSSTGRIYRGTFRTGRQTQEQLESLNFQGLEKFSFVLIFIRVVNFQAVKEDVVKAKASGDKYLYEYAKLQTYSPGTWDDIAWIKSITTLPVILKGIVTAESAREAVAAGVEGIIVSAHGGRQLDGIQAPIEALPEVVDAVRRSGVEVYVDGGVRSGRDIFKALAIGAKAAFIGRPVLWGLSHNGEDGVTEVLNMLKAEFANTMSLCGFPNVEEVNRTFIRHESQLTCKL